MKLLSKLILSFSVFCMLACLQAQGQTYYNFARGEIGSTSSYSLIRTVDAQRAVAYYENLGVGNNLLRVGMDGFVREARFNENDIEIKDMRVVGDDVFFCGIRRSTRRGILGHALVSAIEGGMVNITYREIDLGITGSSTFMWPLAAYPDGSGSFRVVAVGEMYYSYSSSVPWWFYISPGFYYEGCHTFLVVEYKYSGGMFSPLGCKFFSDYDRYERADGVVLTDNWLAIISFFPQKNELNVHRCNKYNVIGTLDNYYSYAVAPGEGVYHCCKMKGDTIALVGLANVPGTALYETHMRTVDLGSMAMTSAQMFSLLAKAEPEEIVYMPESTMLVLLQHQQFPSSAFHYAYVYLKPYVAPPYTASLIYEGADHPFHSIDRLTYKHIVAAGGAYWMEKDIQANNPSAGCYTVDGQPIVPLSTVSPMINSYGYCPRPFVSNGDITIPVTCTSPVMSNLCIDYQ